METKQKTTGEIAEAAGLPNVRILVETSYGIGDDHGVTMYILQAERKGTWVEGRNSRNIQAFTHTTKQQAEIRTICSALDRINRPCCVKILMSNPTIAASVNGDYPRLWKKNNWQGTKGPIKNAEDWDSFLAGMASHIHKGNLIETGPHPLYAEMQSDINEKLKEIQHSQDEQWIRNSHQQFTVTGE